MESEAGGINVTQPWRSKLILAFGLLPGAYTVRDAPVPTPQRCPSHATRRSQIAAHHPPAARQPVAYHLAGRVEPSSSASVVSQTLLGFLRGLRHLERFTRAGMHHLAVVAVVPGSGAGRWSVGCAAAGVVEVSVLLASS